jgi:hypothetical protein
MPNFLDRLANLFAPPPPPTSAITVRCKRCGEIISARLNLQNDLTPEYDASGNLTYFCHKILMGSGRCFQRIDVAMTFDRAYRLIDCQVQGGDRIE